MSLESFATKQRTSNLHGGGLYGFQSSQRISDFESRIAKKDLATQQHVPNSSEWRRVTVVAGWIFNETVIGESLNLRLGLPQLDANTCCVWIELSLTLSSDCMLPIGDLQAAETSRDSLLAWNTSIINSFSQSSRVRELSSLTSAAALQVLPRLSSGLELYYIYCWEGKAASVMSKAKAVQSALLLERALLTAFYQSPGIDRFISQRILDANCLFPLRWLESLTPNELRMTANSLLNENRLLFRLISQVIKPARVIQSGDSIDDNNRSNSGWPPPSGSADQAVADIRMLAEQLPQSLPSKRVLTSLLLPAGPIQNEVMMSADGRAEIRIGLDSIRHEMRPPEEESINPSSNIVTVGGSMSFTSNESSIFTTTRPGSEQHLTRPINRPTLPQLKSLNLNRRRPAEKREDGLGGSGGPVSESPPIGLPYDSHRTSSLSATPHDNEEVVSTQRSVKARKLDSNNVVPSRIMEGSSGPPVLLGSHSSSSSLSSEADDDDAHYGESESLSPSSSSIASSPQRVPRLVPKAQGAGGGFIRLPPTLPQRSTLGVPELGLTCSARHEGSADAGPPSRRSPEVDRNSALAKYRFICSEILEDQLYLSGEGVASSLDILQKHRITHIVNSAGDTCPNYFPGKFNYLTFVLQDSRLTNETLEAVLFFALDFIQRAIDSGGRLLVHCREGVSRSCTLVCAYLMCSRHMTFQAALDHVRSVREMCNPNTGFTFTLLKLGKRLHAAETDGGGSGIGDKKLSRVSLHHLAAPFMVVLGVSLWEPTHQSWMPGGKALSLDPRFYYVLRDHPCIYVWKGSAIPKHMDRLMRKAIERYICDIKRYEKLPDEVCQAIEVEEGNEPDEFWTTLYIDCKRMPSTRVAQNSALDEEANYLAHEFPHVSVFDIEEWEQQLRRVDEETPKTHTFTFIPPKSTPRTMEAARRSNIRHFGRHDSPLVAGSATHRIEMTPSYAASSRRVRNSLGLATPPESQQRRRFGARSRLSQSGETPQAMMSASQSAGLTANSTRHESTMEEQPEEDYQSGFTRRSLLSVPQQSIAIGIRRPSDGAGKEGRFETGVLYAFTYPSLDEAVAVDDDEILTDRSSDIILFVLFGQSALTPVQLPPLDDETDDNLLERANHTVEDQDGLYTPGEVLDEETQQNDQHSRASKRNYTVPPIVLEPRVELQQPLATAIPAGKRPATAGPEFESLARNLQQEANDEDEGDLDKEWETTIWLWEGSDTDIQSDDYRDSIISSFCKIHSLDPHLLWVYSEKEGAETSKFLEMLYLS